MVTINQFIRNMLIGQRAARVGGMDRRAFLRSCIIGGAALPFVNKVTLFDGKPSYRQYQIDLIKAMGRGDLAAMDAFAAFITPSILQVIEQAPIFSNLFDGSPVIDFSTPITIPLDLHWAPPSERGHDWHDGDILV